MITCPTRGCPTGAGRPPRALPPGDSDRVLLVARRDVGYDQATSARREHVCHALWCGGFRGLQPGECVMRRLGIVALVLAVFPTSPGLLAPTEGRAAPAGENRVPGPK